MVSTVFLADATTSYGNTLLDKVSSLFRAARFGEGGREGGLVAIKLHFGEAGNMGGLSPLFARQVAEEVRALGGKPFLTDTSTLYRGPRRCAVDHLQVAVRNGYSFATVGVPIVIADGIRGTDCVVEHIPGDRFSEVKIASAVAGADALIALTHVTAHALFGFGGAVKNVGMGGATPAGKQMMHSELVPRVKPVRCTGCARCFEVCPAEAIAWTKARKARIDKDKCIGCGECTVLCPEDAIIIQWKTDERVLQEKTAEYALGVVRSKQGRCGFYNFLLNITPQCDCESFNNPPVVPDLGILGSTDPVAIDQASADLVNERMVSSSPRGGDDFFRTLTGRDWSFQLDHGERIGLGTRRYKLVRL